MSVGRCLPPQNFRWWTLHDELQGKEVCECRLLDCYDLYEGGMQSSERLFVCLVSHTL